MQKDFRSDIVMWFFYGFLVTMTVMLMACSGGENGDVINGAVPESDPVPDTPVLPPQRAIVDLLVSTKGQDTVSCGAPLTPCRSVEYAVENRAQAGERVGIQPGIYDETGSIEMPAQVSITGMGEDAEAVVLRPDYAASSRRFFINLLDSELDQVGDQSISWLTLDAHAASNVGWRAIQVQNRNDVRIHHCRITHWDRQDRTRNSAAVVVVSTEKLKFKRSEWWKFLPSDLGPAGDYSSWVDWPQFPVKNFEFDNNLVLRSGDRQRNIDGALGNSYRPGGALNMQLLQDSSIHDNEFDLRGVFSKAIAGISAFWDNVDTYGNIFRVTSAQEEGWMGPTPTWNGTFALETWMHINGSEWYNNVSNDGWSIAKHKDSEIHHNIILRDRARSMGLEVALIDHTSVHHNYILGGRAQGISTRQRRAVNQRDGWIYNNILVNVQNWGIRAAYDRRFCDAGSGGAQGMAMYNNLVDTTRWGGISVVADCDTVEAPLDFDISNNIVLRSDNNWAGIVFQMSDAFNTLNASVSNNLLFANARNSVQCKSLEGVSSACSAVARAGISETGSVLEAPGFEGSPDVVIVDNSDAGSTQQQGVWSAVANAELRLYGADSAEHVAGAGDWFEFQAADLSPDQPTVVALWWPRNFSAGRSSVVPVSVYDGDSTEPLATYTVNQASWDSGEWYYLGQHVFKSERARLRVHSVDDGAVVADAALWVKLGYGYRLGALSPAIDAGSPRVEPIVKTDFLGNPVPRGRAPDIGIYER